MFGEFFNTQLNRISLTELAGFSGHKRLRDQAPIISDNFPFQCFSDHKAQDDSKRYLLLMEGRVFNMDFLLEKINESEHLLPPTSSGARILLESYKKFGDQFINLVHADSIILILDKENDELKVFGDPLGVMQFYYSQEVNSFLFSTDLSRLKNMISIKSPDLTYVDLCLQHIYPPSFARTWFNEIKKIPPGSVLTIDRLGNKEISRYFEFKATNLDHLVSDEDYLKAFRSELLEAVQRNIDDTSVDCHLSGGLDSTGIAAISTSICKKSSIALRTYACALEEKQRDNRFEVEDESDFINSIIENSNIPKPTLVSDHEEISLDKVLYGQDFPIPFNLQVYLRPTLDIIEKSGGKILLSGFGGDEAISSKRFPHFLANAFWQGKYSDFWFESRQYGFRRTAKAMVFSLMRIYLKVLSIFNISHGRKKGRWTYRFSATKINEDIISHVRNTHVSSRITMEKQIAHAFGIEMRYPFLDTKLLSFYLGLPAKFKVPGKIGREFYRKALRKWINYEPFQQQRKSRVATVPITLLQLRRAVFNQSFDIHSLVDNLEEEIRSVLKKQLDFDNTEKDNDEKKLNKVIRGVQLDHFIKQCKQEKSRA